MVSEIAVDGRGGGNQRVGILRGEAILDLCYEEDSSADVDANVVMTDGGRFVEFQCHGRAQELRRRADGPYDRTCQEGCGGADRDSEGGNRTGVKIYCATGNAGKLREFRLAGELLGIDIELIADLKSISPGRERRDV